MHYYDPQFYLVSEEMPFTIRVEANLKERVNEEAIRDAVDKAIRRYPYFAVEVKEENGEWITVPNPRPVVVYRGAEVLPLGSEAVNRHIIAVSFDGPRLHFFMSHVIADGSGFFPFIQTALYYYFCASHRTELNPEGIRLWDSPLLQGEIENPFPEEAMASAKPLYVPPKKPFLRLADGEYVNDDKPTAYRLRISEAELMRFSFDHDGSPCALVSALMTKAIWELHPGKREDIVSAISFNMRPGLGNRYSYRMLCSALMLRYSAQLRNADAKKICTCTRGMITLQSQPENVLYMAQQRRLLLEEVGKLPDVVSKRKMLAPLALADSIDNTFSVSYVGKMKMGSMEAFIDSMYNYTDGSTYRTLFIEINAINGWFDIAFLQGFSGDAYYQAFLRQLRENDLYYIEEMPIPMGTPKMVLPELSE